MTEAQLAALSRARDLFTGTAERLTDGMADETVADAMLTALVEFMLARWGPTHSITVFAMTAEKIQIDATGS